MLRGMSAPEEGTIERWCWDYVSSTSLDHKLAPPEPPAVFEAAPVARWIEAPGRPPELVQQQGKVKTPRPGALKNPAKRAQVLHAFLHHELQAAELSCWAILAFPGTPRSFRRGLLKIARDELRHMALYRRHLVELGHPPGSFPINDWFWSRVPLTRTPAQFVATLGIGFEGGNLDHALRFSQRFRDAGDDRAAEIQELIGREEIPHVAFALSWFERFSGSASFDPWREQLPRPLTPLMMCGDPLNREWRTEAGFSPDFLDELSRWRTSCGS